MTGTTGAVLRLDDSRASSGERRAIITIGSEEHELWIRRLDGGPLDPVTGADPFLMAAMLLFMARGVDVHVMGTVSRRLLRGLQEWQGAWARWLPDQYTVVAITADEVVDGAPTNQAAVSAYSGGVDANYTLHRHLTGRANWQTVDLRAALMVQGFDIPVDDDATFASAQKRAQDALGGIGVQLVTMATNWRDLGQNWEHGHALALASCLTSLAPEFGIGLIGSSEAYDGLVIPWGSSPITDHLLSTGMVDVRHDGADASRTDKVALLTEVPGTVADNLRVCWQGESLDRNCGQCEKCQRTLMNFRAVGVEDPACMPADAGTRPVLLKGAIAMAEWRSLAAYAERAGRPQVAARARQVVRRSTPRFLVKRAVQSLRG